jgi:hypothetical protein
MLNTFIATAGFVGSYTVNSPKFSKGDSGVRNDVLSGVSVQINMKRRPGTYAITQFIPLTIVTSCGLASLFVDPAQPPARIALCILAVLALVALSFSFLKDLPDTPYLTNTSIYNIISLFFAWVNIPIFALVHNLKMHADRQQTKKKKKQPEVTSAVAVVAASLKENNKVFPNKNAGMEAAPAFAYLHLPSTPANGCLTHVPNFSIFSESVGPPPLAPSTNAVSPIVTTATVTAPLTSLHKPPKVALWAKINEFFKWFVVTGYVIMVIVFFPVTTCLA